MSKSLSNPNDLKVRSGKRELCAAVSEHRSITLLWLAMLFSIVSFSNVYGEESLAAKKITLNMRNATLTEVFKEIEHQTGVVFVSSADDLKNTPRVDAEYIDTPATAVLNGLFKNIGLDYKVTEDYVSIFRKEPDAQTPAQTRFPFSGRVVSAEGEPLDNVAVMEEGVGNGVISDSDGSFLIYLSGPDATVVFSTPGYEQLEIIPAGRNNLTLTMSEIVTEMEQIIVVAYGTQRKSSVTGSISTISAKELNTVSSPNVNSMLQGKVAGMQVTNTSGKPGEAAIIRIRGKSSLGGGSTSDPLWVIDGIISGTGSQLNPNDIETISILKDASATALYGSRATNGVIIVTTKSGRTGENRIDVNVKFGVAQQNLGNFKLMNSSQLYDYTMAMDRLPAEPWLYDREKVLSHDTDWFDFATQSGLSGNYTLSHTMGTEKVRNFLSGDYYHETGTVRGFSYDRFTVRDNLDLQVTKRLNLHVKVAGSYQNTDDRQHDLYSAMTYLPWDYPYNPDGSVRTGREEDWYGRDDINYLYNTSLNWTRAKQLGVTGTFGFDYDITDWLTFESTNNIGFRMNRSESYEDPNATGAGDYSGSITNSLYLVTTRYTNQLLRFNYLLDSKHEFNAFLGYEFSDYFYEDTDATGRSIPIGTEILGVAANAYSVGGNKYGSAMQSFYFNANYTYDDRYNAQFSYRLDGSSKFGPDVRYGNFWTIGLAWSIDKENFMRDVRWVDFLKLRGSYGSIGSQSSLGFYDFMSTYTLELDYNGVKAAFPDVMGNPALTWEKCFETNIAVDARFWGRLGLTIDFYNKNTSDLLYYEQLSTTITGFRGQYRNIGSLRNRGIEITLSPDIIKTKDWQWSMDINFGLNRNKITELANDNADQVTGNYIFRVGYDRDTFYLAEWAGVDVYTGQPLWYNISSTGEKTLTTDYDSATKVMSGSAAPKWFGGITTTVSYKNFTLSALGTFVYGNTIFHYARQFYDNDGAYPTYNSLSIDAGPNWKRWEKPGDIASHPQAIWGGNSLSNQPSTRYLEDGSYFRLVNATLSYDLPQRWINKIHVKNARVFVNAENLFTITRFSGADVEVGAGADNGISGPSVYPSARRFSFGLNVSF